MEECTEYVWIAYVICMAYIWNMHGICMQCVCAIREYVWDVYGTNVRYVCHIICLLYVWNKYGTCMECGHRMYGVRIPDSKNAHGIRIKYVWDL